MNVPDGVPPVIQQPEVSALAPFRHRIFRMLWVAWLLASLCMWMTEVAAAWLMTSLSRDPVMVALVQTAAAAPVFMFGLPTGALADILDRRRILIFTQVWAAVVAIILAVLSIANALTPTLLLILVFANGIVLATRWPVFSAIVPTLVPRPELQAAMALNGVANNGSRIIGPLMAGAILAAAGSKYVFALNVVFSLAAIILVARWRYETSARTLPSERFIGAIRIGLQHVRQSSAIQRVLVRLAAFFLHSIALIALIPLVALRLPDGGAGVYTLLLSAMGAGSVLGAFFLLPFAQRRMGFDRRVTMGTLMFGMAMAAVALAPNLYVAMPAMLVAGSAFMLTANTLMIAAQTVLPDWVRARGLSAYQMVMMGSSAVGAALWGFVASITDVEISLLLATAAGAVGLFLTRNLGLISAAEEDLTPAQIWTMPELAIEVEPHDGPLLVTYEYRIDPERTQEFLDTMRESRRVWLANGLLSWSLFNDLSQPGHFIEHMLDESWAAYVRRNERVSASYVPLRERKMSFHVGPGAPIITRYLARNVAL